MVNIKAILDIALFFLDVSGYGFWILIPHSLAQTVCIAMCYLSGLSLQTIL